MIAVIDHRLGNFGSIVNMLKKIGADAVVSSDADQIRRADKLILPGVGAFQTGMRNLRELGLIPLLHEKVIERRTPILGICLGMQMFSKRSEEGTGEADEPGLGWLEADTVRFQPTGERPLKLPHMGWNYVAPCQDHPLLGDLGPEPRFYFVHSYHVQCARREDVLLETDYAGRRFVSAVRRDNILGTQFHPEKSHRYGMHLLRNFVHGI